MTDLKKYEIMAKFPGEYFPEGTTMRTWDDPFGEPHQVAFVDCPWCFDNQEKCPDCSEIRHNWYISDKQDLVDPYHSIVTVGWQCACQSGTRDVSNREG